MTIEDRVNRAPTVGADLRTVLAASGTGTWRWDASTGYVEWDETMAALCGLTAQGFGADFDAWLATLHPDELEMILNEVNDAIERLAGYHFEHRTVWPDGTVRWLECRGQVTVDDVGSFSGTVGCAVDVTDRHAEEEARARLLERERQAHDRLSLLVRLTDATLSATDHRHLMRCIASASLPTLGDWCSVYYVPDLGSDLEMVVSHRDPRRACWADALERQMSFRPECLIGVPGVIKTGRAELVDQVDSRRLADALDRISPDADAVREALDELGLASVITVPLRTKRGVRGAMQFVSSTTGRTFDHDDLALAEIAAARIADSLDNTWLTEQHQRISETLQRALLPPRLPSIPGIEVAVRYWPAGTAVEAGGDFYDVFGTRDGWSVLIGDVCGTGPDAAALTGIARHTVRAAARHGYGHRDVLEWLNEAMRLSDRDRFCTAVYCTLDQIDGCWRFTSCAAGHPLPIVARADRSSGLLGRPGSLLGVFEALNLGRAETNLEPGDVVVLYTDGITDLPPPYGQTDSDVVELVRRLVHTGSAEAIADAVHASVAERLGDAQHADDVALVVLKVVAAPQP